MYHNIQSNISFIIPTNIQHRLHINGQDYSRHVLANYRLIREYSMPMLMKCICRYNKGKIYPKCTERTTLKPCRAIYNQSNLWYSKSLHVFHSWKGQNDTTHPLKHLSRSVKPIPAFTCIVSKNEVGTHGCRWHHGSQWQFDSVEYRP